MDNLNFGQVPASSFSNPFMSVSNRWLPSSMYELFRLCEWMFHHNGIYRAALERIARLFVTEFKYDCPESTIGLDLIKKYLETSGNFKQVLISIGTDYLVYGNSFISLYLPFRRTLKCSKCKKTYSSDVIEDLSYNADGKFVGKCLNRSCGNTTFKYRDEPNKDFSKVHVLRIAPNEMEIIHNKVSGNNTYYWNMSRRERDKYINGKGTLLVSETPVEILEAAMTNKKIQFSQDELLHLSQPALAGTDIDWGMPFSLSCFPLIFYIAVLRKANEAVSMDYIIPLRIIYPQSGTSNQEAIYMNLKDYVSKIKDIIKHHKLDPADWHVAPSPIGYQVIGGEKRSLMISDDIKLSNDELLNSIGFPAELFYGTLGLQATPMALRLLENTFSLTSVYSKITNWVLKKVTTYCSIDSIETSMTPLKWADDIERRQMLINLAGANKISDMTMLELYGMDYETEEAKKIKQMQIITKLQNKYQEDTNRQQQSSGGEGGGGAPSLPSSPTDIMASAQDMAQQLIVMDPDQRKSKLDEVLKMHPLLHHAIVGIMGQLKRKMQYQGGQMLLDQQRGGLQPTV